MTGKAKPPSRPAAEGTVAAAAEDAAARSRQLAALRDRLRRLLDQPAAAEAMARAVKGWLRRDG